MRGVCARDVSEQWGLERVRAELMRATPGSDSVTDAATRWGFQHLGHFSASYRRQFGETPSETLKRD